MQQFKRSYKELMRLPSFEERYRYLKLQGRIGEDTFGLHRYLNQVFYSTIEWKRFRREIIIRDNGFDLGSEDYPIVGKVIIHHINPLTIEDIRSRSSVLMDPDNVICVSHLTHEAIHYGDEKLLPKDPVVRRPGDHCPWL